MAWVGRLVECGVGYALRVRFKAVGTAVDALFCLVVHYITADHAELVALGVAYSRGEDVEVWIGSSHVLLHAHYASPARKMQARSASLGHF